MFFNNKIVDFFNLQLEIIIFFINSTKKSPQKFDKKWFFEYNWVDFIIYGNKNEKNGRKKGSLKEDYNALKKAS